MTTRRSTPAPPPPTPPPARAPPPNSAHAVGASTKSSAAAPGGAATAAERAMNTVTQPTRAAKPKTGTRASANTEVLTPVAPFQVNLEEQLCRMFQDTEQSPVLLCLGQKGGGKSFRTMTLLMWLLRNNVFDQYFLVLPTYFIEAANSYAWLQPFADKVFVTREYTPELSQAFLQRPDETSVPQCIPRTFLWLDDVGMNEAFRTDRHFVGLLSVARHKRLSVCLCYHSLTSGHTLSPFLRQNVTHTLLFRVTNEKLLESVFEELISMTGHFQRFREFKQVYNQHTCSQIDAATGEIVKNFNGICINNSIGCMDWNLGEWFREDTETLRSFLDNIRRVKDENKLPPPNKHQQIKDLDAKMVENVKGAGPNVGIAQSGNQIKRNELTADSWPHVKQAVADPLQFITNPKHLVRYQMTVQQQQHDTPKKRAPSRSLSTLLKHR